MSKESQQVEKALVELTGATRSDIRNVAHTKLVEFAQGVLVQQTQVRTTHSTPPLVQTTQTTLPMKGFAENPGSKAVSAPSMAGVAPYIVRVVVGGEAEDLEIANATLLP